MSATIEIPILDQYIPGINITAFASGIANRSKKGNLKKNAFAHGKITLDVSKSTRILKVNVIPEHEFVNPSSTLKVNVNVSDINGPKCNSEGIEISMNFLV